VGGSYEGGNELSGSVRGGEFLHHLSDYKLIKKDFDPSIGSFMGSEKFSDRDRFPFNTGFVVVTLSLST
jgi:hypothetical protein